MGPYCKFCGQRCFLPRVLKDGRSVILATCASGMKHDLKAVGETHGTAINPCTPEGPVLMEAMLVVNGGPRTRTD
jgi:hypothetical protein